ncbi:SDR family NAD(P)-dependent oxidoreductase [Bremerella volcania]|uniref:SDR family NAD(P)-dependent oxidoreductase n=1 Tax=Bremerella volcania TaxID=2527984 RepID=UPI0011A601AB|nr:SDR family NAD(P)-dependent oxidoreductase [Bremerella volcania]
MTYWKDKVSVVTGASQGFGKALAQQLITQGCHVVLAARDEQKLSAAAAQLDPDGTHSLCVPTDVTNDDDVVQLLDQVQQKYGKLDALFNVAGISSRGLVCETSIDEFLCSYDLNVLSTVRCVQAARPLLEASQGHIVNMGSLACKSASKFIGPYATSKFALAGLNHQLRLEMADAGIHVMLVCPGPIARDDAGTRYAQQTTELPDSAAQPGAGVKVKAIDPQSLAARVLKGCEKRQTEIVVPGKARLLFAIAQLSGAWGDWVLRRFTSS